MANRAWRQRAGTTFTCEKAPAQGAKAMVVSNHPLGSAAGAQILAAGGNAIDAAVATLFALTVVEPMMVGIFGGGMAHVRLADGRHTVFDGLSTAPAACGPDSFTPVSDTPPHHLDTKDRESAIGVKASAVPGTLKGWCDLLEAHGKLSLADVMAPAISHAERGFLVTHFLSDCIGSVAADMTTDAEIAKLYMPGGTALAAGDRLVQSDYAATLRSIAKDGPGVLYGGALGQTIADHMARQGGFMTLSDLANYSVIERDVLRGTYRDFEIVGPPPPSSGGVHVLQMLNILEGYDIAGMGFGTADSLHLLAEVLKIAFADRAVATADPDFIDVPVARLIDKAYGDERRAEIDMTQARDWQAAVAAGESPNTTHVTVVDGDGAIVASTQTINSLFGAKYIFPGTGIIGNNYMNLFDPHPGRALSVAPGKRITTSQAPLIALKDGQPVYALGLPGGLRIFGTAMQALINLIDHGMTLQEAVEAPRLWTQGQAVEIEDGFAEAARRGLAERGHEVAVLPHVAGGMNAIAIDPDGMRHGAACWRADGTAIGLGGGTARPNVRFWPDQAGPANPDQPAANGEK